MVPKIHINTKNNFIFKNKIINILTKNGSREVSEKNLSKILKLLNKSLNKNIQKSIQIFVVKNSPFVSVYKRAIKNRSLNEIPFLLKPSLRVFYAIKNISRSVTSKKSFYKSFIQELTDTLNNKSFALKNKEDLYKLVFSKKAFSHFRWF